MKKLLAILLLASLCTLISCSENANDNSTTTTTKAGENSQGEAAENAAEVKDPDAPDLPAADMGGKVFTFLASGWGEITNLTNDIAGEEMTGEPIDDAAYQRRIKIEQTYNTQIKVVAEASADETVNKYKTSILAADGSYDAAFTTCTNFTSLLGESYLVDFTNLPYVDMDKPYWNKNFYDTMSIMGNHFAADGDISKRRLECVWIMAFNKNLIEDNGLDSPYDLVKNGQWTYDKMHDMAKTVANDINGDGKMTLEDDMWGINYTGDTIMGIINGSGVTLAKRDSDGIPYLTVGEETNLERIMRIYENMRDHTYSIDTLFKTGGGLTGLGDADIFAENRSLFLACASHNVVANKESANNTQGLRELNVDFGIIPYPKWDAAQPDYLPHTAGNYHPVLSVPVTNLDLENTSIILEAMAYEGKQTITPAFYESLLKTKTARDEESADMLDYIFGNIRYDIGVMFNFGGILGTFGYDASTNLKLNLVSTIEKTTPQWQSAIDKLVNELNG